jgi:hypothetical protein
MMNFAKIGLMLLMIGLVGCSTCKCKSIDDQGKIRDASDPAPTAPDKPTTPAAPAELPAVVPNSGTTTLNATNSAAPAGAPVVAPSGATQSAPPTTAEGTIRVYKYDNSRQCGQGKPLDLEEMSKQLKGIKIVSQEKKNDGMMRIQMCGAPTGIANVYEIEQKNMKKAVKAGFREWKYSAQ